MNDLFAPRQSAEQIFNDGFRMEMVQESNFEPRLRRGDFVMIRPVTEYLMEGMYLLYDPEAGTSYLKVVSPTGLCSKLRLLSDNGARYPDYVEREWFNGRVIGVVIAEIKMVGEHFIDWPVTVRATGAQRS